MTDTDRVDALEDRISRLEREYIELLGAAKGVLPLLKASTDKSKYLDRFQTMSAAELLEDMKKDRETSNVPESVKLRRQADEIEDRDAAILRFRNAVAAFGEG